MDETSLLEVELAQTARHLSIYPSIWRGPQLKRSKPGFDIAPEWSRHTTSSSKSTNQNGSRSWKAVPDPFRLIVSKFDSCMATK